MEAKMKRLPLSIDTFEEMREGNYVYADKTRFLVNMIDEGKIYFLARPRRFGKSLTVSTLEAMFSGKKHLFEGLYAEEFMNREDYRASPVIHLDMSDVTTNEGIKVISSAIKDLVIDQAESLGIELDARKAPGELLSALIRRTSRKENKKVVILIDEYDKPYSDFIDDRKMAEEVRKVLRNFYIRVKANSKYIRFTFITGVAKFVKFGVFSGLNTPTDISMDAKYGEMCGLTAEETVRCFPDYIADTAKATGNTPEGLLERMRDYYDGFCFDGVHRLYNPYSTLCFFDKQNFRNFWMKSGTSQLIADYMKTKKLTVEQFRNFSISKDFADEPGELDSTPPEGFLYQGGYLTIREEKEEEYILDYPNREVLNAMSRLLARNILSADNSFENLRTMLLKSLSEKNIEMFKRVLNALLANVPYDDFETAGEVKAMMSNYAFTAREWIYRSSILAFLRGCGVEAVAEMHTNLGRADLVVRHGGNTFVLELKVARGPKKVPAKLAEAEKQMKAKNYLVPYPGATGLALVIDDTKRLITTSKAVTSEEQQ